MPADAPQAVELQTGGARVDGRLAGSGSTDVPSFSVVFPCLNEERTLRECIRRARGSLAALGVAGEVIVADNGSSDSSVAIALEEGACVVHVAERGYGAALASGINEARGEFVIMGDADGSYDFGKLEGFVERLQVGCDLVIGNRLRGEIEPGAMPPLHRYVGTPVLSFLGRRFFGGSCGDVNCGLRGFRREAVVGLDLRSLGMEFASEMLAKASLEGLRVEEVPIGFHRDGRDRPPHLNTWRDGWRHLRLLLLYSPRWLFLYPGLALTALGLAGLAWLLPGPQSVGSVTFDVHTLFYAAITVVIGCQALLFALLANAFAVADGLLPERARFRPRIPWLSIEVGLVTGALLVVGGVVASALALARWERNSFGHLDYSHTMRFVIPGGTAVALGCEVVLASFLLSLFQLRRR